MTPVRLEPAALRSRVKNSTTEPLRSHISRMHVPMSEVLRAMFYLAHAHKPQVVSGSLAMRYALANAANILFIAFANSSVHTTGLGPLLSLTHVDKLCNM